MRAVEVLQQCGAQQQGLATRRQLAAAGLTGGALHRAVAVGQLVRVRPGTYALGPLSPWPRFAVTDAGPAPAYVAQVRAVLLSLGPSATAAYRTAACLRGWGLLQEPVRTVEVARTRSARAPRLTGVRSVRRRRLERELWTPLPGTAEMRVTSAVQTALDCCTVLPLRQAAVVVDSALRSGQVTLEELVAAAARLPGRRRAGRVRRALALCDPAAGSVLETVLRLALLEAGVTGFATQVVLRDERGRRIHRVDLCFDAERLVVEADGRAWHTDAVRDRGLDNRLAAAGWRVLRLDWALVVEDTPAAVELVVRALAAGRVVGQSHRREGLRAA